MVDFKTFLTYLGYNVSGYEESLKDDSLPTTPQEWHDLLDNESLKTFMTIKEQEVQPKRTKWSPPEDTISHQRFAYEQQQKEFVESIKDVIDENGKIHLDVKTEPKTIYDKALNALIEYIKTMK